MNLFDKEFMLDSLVSLEITMYSMSAIFDTTPDVSVQETMIISALKHLGCTLEEVENAIKEKDFTKQLTDFGSGKRERGFVMDWVKEVWDTCENYSKCIKTFKEY